MANINIEELLRQINEGRLGEPAPAPMTPMGPGPNMSIGQPASFGPDIVPPPSEQPTIPQEISLPEPPVVAPPAASPIDIPKPIAAEPSPQQDIVNKYQEMLKSGPQAIDDSALKAAQKRQDTMDMLAILNSTGQGLAKAFAAGGGAKLDTSSADKVSDILRQQGARGVSQAKEGMASQKEQNKARMERMKQLIDSYESQAGSIRNKEKFEKSMIKMDQDIRRGKLDVENKEKLSDPNSKESKTAQQLSEELLGRPSGSMNEMDAASLSRNLPLLQQIAGNAIKEKQMEARNKKDDIAERRQKTREQAEERRVHQAQINNARNVLKDDPRFKKAIEQGMEFEAVDELLGQANSGNEQAVAALGTKLARAMGEVGVLTDTDVVRYVQGASWGQKLQTWFDKGAKGKLPPAVVSGIQNNLKVLGGKLKTDVNRVYSNASKRMKVFHPELEDTTIKGMLGEPMFKGVGEDKGPQEVKRRTKDGKTAIFDANTKKFIRYEGE